MAVRRAWYRAAKYKRPMGPEPLGDGSVVQVVKMDSFSRISREYPSGFRQHIDYEILPDGSANYITVGAGPVPFATSDERRKMSEEERTARFDADLQNGDVRITARGPIPGAGLGKYYDDATKKSYGSTEEFEREYDQQKLAKAMASDHSTMHHYSEPAYNGSVGSVQPFAVDTLNAVPPMPRRGI